MITKQMKETMVKEIAEDLKSAELVVVTDYRGLNVKAINRLRGQLREKGCRYKITKNTLNLIACKEVGVEGLDELFAGPTAIAYASDDPVAAAKVLIDYAKENEALVVKGGILAGQALSPAEVTALGEIPPREVLLSQVVGGFQAPISGLVGVLQGTIRKFVYTLDAVREQKESA